MKTQSSLTFAEPVIGMVLDCGTLSDCIEISYSDPLSHTWYSDLHLPWSDGRCDQLEAIIAESPKDVELRHGSPHQTHIHEDMAPNLAPSLDDSSFHDEPPSFDIGL